MYRQYENPHVIEEELKEAKAALEMDRENEFLAERVYDLEERLRFAWDDD